MKRRRPRHFLCRAGVAALLLSCPGFAGQSLVLNGNTGSYTVPNRAPFTSLGSFRVEMRIHDIRGCTADYVRIWDFGALDFICVTAGGRLFYFRDGAASVTTGIDLTGRSDVVLRLQRDIRQGVLHAEWWNVDGSGRGSSERPLASTTPTNIGGRRWGIGDAHTLLDIAWVHWFSTLVPAGGPPPSSAPGGDLADWEMEGNGTDSGPYGMHLAINATYQVTPSFPPVAVVSVAGTPPNLPDLTLRAGFPAQLDGTGSGSLADSPDVSLLWSQISGPTTLQWSDPTSLKPTITGLVFGQYTVRLTVTDASGQSAWRDLTFGAVACDDNGVVIYPDPKLDFVFGPTLRFGTGPWPWADVNQRNLSNAFGGKLLNDPAYQAQWRSYLAGTVNTTAKSAVVSGNGTNFQADFCNGGTAPTANAQLVLYTPDGAALARDVNSCQSATQLTLQPYEANNMIPLAGATYAKMDGTTPLNWGWAWNGMGGSSNANYYDNVLAHYNLYYRTGLTKYRDYARMLAARWVDSPWFGQAPYPRMWVLNGILLNAWEEGLTARWALLEPMLDRMAAEESAPGTVGDIREEGYKIAYLALAAVFEPDAVKAAVYTNAIKAAKTARWLPSRNAGGYQESDLCGWAWDCNAYDQLNWGADVVKGSRKVSAPAERGTASVANGSTQVTGVGTRLKTRLCRGGATPPHPNGMANERIVFWLGNQQYSVGLIASCQDETHVTLKSTYGGTTLSDVPWSLSWPYWDTALYWYIPTDTIHLTNGSRTATFSSADIQSRACNGSGSTTPDYYSALVIRLDTAKDEKMGFVEVQTCDAAGRITMKDPWAGATGNYQYMQPSTNVWFTADPKTTGYQISFLDPVNAILDRPYEGETRSGATWRFGGGTTVQPFMEGIATTAWNWASKLTGDMETKNWVIENINYVRDHGYWPAMNGFYYFSAGPGCGPPNPAWFLWCTGGAKAGDQSSIWSQRFLIGETIHGFSAAYLLSGDSATMARMDELYSACLGRPGYGGNLDNNYCKELEQVENGSKAKDFGFFYGMGNAASWPAARLGGALPAQLVTVEEDFDLSSVPTAAAARMTVIQPAGGTAVTVCTTRPCSLTLDARQGDPWLQIDYLDGSGGALSVGEPQLLHVVSPAPDAGVQDEMRRRQGREAGGTRSKR